MVGDTSSKQTAYRLLLLLEDLKSPASWVPSVKPDSSKSGRFSRVGGR